MEKTVEVPNNWIFDDSDPDAPSYLVNKDTGKRVGVDLSFIEWEEGKNGCWHGDEIDVSIDKPECYLYEWKGYEAIKLNNKVVQACTCGRLSKAASQDFRELTKEVKKR